MPKKEGAPDTTPKWPIEKLAMASFFMPWESRYAKRKCFVKGCDHLVGDDCSPEGVHASPGLAVDLEQYERDHKKGTMRARSGPVCAHCVDRILDQPEG